MRNVTKTVRRTFLSVQVVTPTQHSQSQYHEDRTTDIPVRRSNNAHAQHWQSQCHEDRTTDIPVRRSNNALAQHWQSQCHEDRTTDIPVRRSNNVHATLAKSVPRVYDQCHMLMILASQSPRRRQLLEAAGYQFQVIPPSESAECGVCSGESPPELVARLAFQKAADVAPKIDQGIVIGCDTVAECVGQILGKPQDEDHARQMLQLLRGREHRVLSGLCLWQRPQDEKRVQVAVTRLVMEEVSDQELEQYLATDQWEGKAGAFGYQDGLPWIRILEGSESNVVGLPLELLGDMLKSFA